MAVMHAAKWFDCEDFFFPLQLPRRDSVLQEERAKWMGSRNNDSSGGEICMESELDN